MIGNLAYGKNNLALLDRFNGDLSNWTLDQTGGTVSILMHDYSPKMHLNVISSSGQVSASRSFNEPSGKWILEYDINFASGAVGIMELLDANFDVIATVDCGTTADTVRFSTDKEEASILPFTHGTYKQIILIVDNIAGTIKGYESEDDPTYGSLQQIGSAKRYSGNAITKLRFRSAAGRTGVVFIGELKIYRPELFLIGDSIIDGKRHWSNHPAYSEGRLSSRSIKTSPPSYQLSLLIGGPSNYWVANRAFGGSDTSMVNSKIQSTCIDQGATKVLIAVGHNDIYRNYSLSSMKSNMDDIISKLENAGITGKDIILGNIFPSAEIRSDAQRKQKSAYNLWLHNRVNEIGALYVDLDNAMKDPNNPTMLNPHYNGGCGTHLNPTGSRILAQTIYDVLSNV
jgi:lysophospholipase L1-like esterase